MSGFTTVHQSMGSSAEVHLRDAIAQGLLPGPRILTAVEPLTGKGEKTGTPDEIRAYIRKQKEAGADFIKIYAAGGMRQGEMTMSQEQLNAACDEAKMQGLRTLVHAYREAVRAATLAGCTQVEDGLGASDDDLKMMAERGTYFDPQAGLLLETYLLFKEKYVGTPFFPRTLDGLSSMKEILPMNHELIRRALQIPGLKIVFGTDAVAGFCELPGSGGARNGASNRLDRARHASRHHCARRRSVERHNAGSAGFVCDEEWNCLQERRP